MREHYCVHCIVTQEEYEIAVGRWYALGMEGCEEAPLDDATIDVKVYFSNAGAARAASEELRQNVHRDDSVSVSPVVNEDWNARWRMSMKPALLAPSWWVAPPWLPPPLAPDDKWIKIEPKMAFGTGHHETTRLAARMLVDSGVSLVGASLLDLGTGSGVLCLVGATAGADRCIGIEIDRECRENLAENRLLNGGTGHVSFVIGSIDAIGKEPRFNTIVMNMIHTEAAPLLAACRCLLAKYGQLIWSGILYGEKVRAISDAAVAGFALMGESTENEWWCGRFGERKA